MKNYWIERNNKRFNIVGRFGNIAVYHGKFCVAFNIMTADDAENWIWKNY